MNSRRLLLLAIAIVAVGVFALPGTVSLFSGQHRWYNLSTGTNDVPCEKCHADVAEEMNALAGPHTGETGYGRLKCGYCHRLPPVQHRNTTFESYTYASGDGTGSQPGVESHAASTIPCMYCHSGDKSGVRHTNFATGGCLGLCHHSPPPHEGRYTNDEDCKRCHANAHSGHVYYIPPAGGFSLTLNASDTGEHAAHKAFVMDAISNTKMEDANEACIACHTSIPVKIQWMHARSLEFNATYDKGLVLPPTHFNTSDYEANGTVNVTSYGNYSGGANTTVFPTPVTVWG